MFGFSLLNLEINLIVHAARGKEGQMLKVLIAEDNVMLADILEDFLVFGGYEVCGTAHTVDEAVMLADFHKPDLAVLDYRMAEEEYGSQIRPRLKDKHSMGILYASADSLRNMLTKEDGEACIQKPYRMDDLLSAVRIVQEIKTHGHPCSSAFPKYFYLLENSIDEPRKTA